MSRLTDKDSYCLMHCADDYDSGIDEDCRINKICFERKMYDKLKHYEDLEEAGRLIVLPCKVGDTVWRIVTQQDNYDDSLYKIVMQSSFRLDFLPAMGDRIFITKAEAEAKLAELKEGAK